MKQEITQINVSDIFFQPRVLVVDDEVRIQKACHRLLTEEGCEVDLAENGIKGLRMIEENHFDIILLDLMIPGMSGIEVLSDVKSRHPDTVVIVITGYATLEHSIETMKRGAFDFLSKPFSPQELRIVISKAIEFIRTLQDIATEKSRMRVMINTLSDGVLTTDNQKKIALANPAFLNMMGCSQTSVIGQDVSELIRDDKLLEMINQTLNQPEDEYAELTDEMTIPNFQDNEEMTLGIRCIPFRDRLNRNLGSVTVFHDITARKKIDQLKSDFVSMVAHEIKSPLNSILMQLNVVTEGLAGELSEKQKEILSRTSDRIKSLTMLSSDLLDLSKIESGLINQDKERFDLVGLMKEQIAFNQDRANSKSIHFSVKTSADRIFMLGNRINIEEVLSNLISNAIKYSAVDGKIHLFAEETQTGITIKVADTGFGIPDEDIEYIFDKFYRIKNEKTRFINGTGLGLSIVKRIIEAHHGSIDVISQVDSGTTFTIHIPKTDYSISC